MPLDKIKTVKQSYTLIVIAKFIELFYIQGIIVYTTHICNCVVAVLFGSIQFCSRRQENKLNEWNSCIKHI